MCHKKFHNTPIFFSFILQWLYVRTTLVAGTHSFGFQSLTSYLNSWKLKSTANFFQKIQFSIYCNTILHKRDWLRFDGRHCPFLTDQMNCVKLGGLLLLSMHESLFCMKCHMTRNSSRRPFVLDITTITDTDPYAQSTLNTFPLHRIHARILFGHQQQQDYPNSRQA